jgi:methylmalonyl-CoA/ethylmalonyl-CoA epimerase
MDSGDPLHLEAFTFHHVGVAVKNLDESIPVYGDLFGYKLISGPFDDPIQKVSVCFMSRGDGDPQIELVAPLGADSPINRTLEKGGGTYHICYEVPDIDRAIEHLYRHGSLLMGKPVPAVAFGMRRIAWLMTKARLLVELVQSEP